MKMDNRVSNQLNRCPKFHLFYTQNHNWHSADVSPSYFEISEWPGDQRGNPSASSPISSAPPHSQWEQTAGLQQENSYHDHGETDPIRYNNVPFDASFLFGW